MSIREDFFTAKSKGSLWDVAVSIKRGNPLPLDADSIFESYAALEAYAADVLAYPGQVVAVVNEDSTGIYYLDQELNIKPVGVIPAGDEASIDMDDEDIISLHDFGKAFYKYVPEVKDEETGETVSEAKYERVAVSETNPWKAGLEPKVVTEGGKLVIGWFEPNPTTIEGVNDQVTAVQGTVADLEESVGVPSTEGSPATGLYKEVEDVQEDVEELADAVGTKEDTLGDDVQTLWAYVNDHEGRIDTIEADYLTSADKEELSNAIAAEADRADKAEKANAAAIKAIADDYLKTEDKYDDTALAGRVKAIEDDYLVEADIANMATDAEVEAAVKAEETRAKGVEESLQAQINTIMSNPDAEGAINSINEFTQYVKDHGEIAEGFRTDINKNADDIAAEASAARAAESALSGRLDDLEAIDHEAYIAADTALENKLNAEIDKKADTTALTAAVEALEGADSAIEGRLDAVEAVIGEVDDIAQAITDAKNAAAADATSKANAAQAAAEATAAGLYATKEYVGTIPTSYTETNIVSYINKKAEETLAAAQGGSSETAASVKQQLDTYKSENNTIVEGHTTQITNINTKLNTIEENAEVNIIEVVKVNGVALTPDANRAVDVSVPTSIVGMEGYSELDTRVSAAKTQADKGVDDAAAADAKAVKNAGDIAAQNARLVVVEGLVGDADNGLVKDVAALKASETTHAAEYSALKGTVDGHTSAIAGKAEQSTVDAISAKAVANETAIKTLNETTIPEVNAEIAKKANSADVYTKSEIGAIAEGKTIVKMIEEAQAAATYDDTAVKQLIADEAATARAAEEANAAAIDKVAKDLAAEVDRAGKAEASLSERVETMEAFWGAATDNNTIDRLTEIVTYIENDKSGALTMAGDIQANTDAIAAIYTAADGDAPASGVLVTEIARIEKKANDNTNAIAAINDTQNGILATAEAYTDAAIAGLPKATADKLGLVKVDNVTIQAAEDGVISVKAISTDLLIQGNNPLVLRGGSASD